MTLPSLRSTDDVIEAGRRFADSGWRPTNQEARQLLRRISEQEQRIADLTGETLGYARAEQSPSAASEWWVEGESDEYGIRLYGAVPTPAEIGAGQSVVTVVRRVLP